MKRLEITHCTEYSYHEPVGFGRHFVMLRPREGPDLHIAEMRMVVEPAASLVWIRDIYGNAIGQLDFSQNADRLLIHSRVCVEIFDSSLPSCQVAPAAQSYPFVYPADDLLEIFAYRVPSVPAEVGRVAAWVEERVIKPGESISTTGLLDRLNIAIHEGFRYEARDEEGTFTPAELLRRGAGSCRDYALFFIEAARHLGFPARFVSGYILMGGDQHGATHAWAEVYLPGAGWRGYDPTNRKTAGSEHIPCAVAREARKALPVSGVWSGPADAFSALKVSVRVVETGAGLPASEAA